MSRAQSIDRWLWVAFAALFAIVTLASVLPLRPIILVFPAWSLVVLVTIVVTIAVAVTAAKYGWPVREGAT